MSSRTGLGPMEVALLQSVADLGGIAGAAHRLTTTVLDTMQRDHGFGARYAYPMLVDLIAPWRLHLPLLDGLGNFGSQHGDTPADARYTEVRLSPVGALALAAERGQVGPVPLGLIEGSLYRDGPIPPFNPIRMLAALTSHGLDAGPPTMPTGGTVEGDLEGLVAGLPTRLVLGSTIAQEPGQLVITEVPLGVTINEIALQLHNRMKLIGEQGPTKYLAADRTVHAGVPAPAPIRDIRDESSGRTGIRVVASLAPLASLEQARAWIKSVWPVTIHVDCQLPAPMSHILATWERGDGSGLRELDALI